MKLTQLRLSNFQSFGPLPKLIDLTAMTFLIGPNGAGKTAVLQALARLFGTDLRLRRIRKSDFHVAEGLAGAKGVAATKLWIEAEFEFPELKKAGGKDPAVPGMFAHMRLERVDGVPRVRIRLTAMIDDDGEIEETVQYVIQTDPFDEPTKAMPVPKPDRNLIQVHYLPARRDPADHVSYAASSLLGRTLRAADWKAEEAAIAKLTGDITGALAANAAIQGIGAQLATQWGSLHKGSYYANPTLSFEGGEMDSLLRHLTVAFTPGHGEPQVDFSRLSDGQQSLLYISLVLAVQKICRQVQAGALPAFDIDKLRPAIFTLIAAEEPENSLAQHYLGRVIQALKSFSLETDGQVVVATHAPSLLRRIEPQNIRYLRLDAQRLSTVAKIVMPDKADEAHKFVREAVLAYPELYFSRLVILGEGDSEEVVIPKVLEASSLGADESSISIVPLGGRHVNHFWRLLHGLGIPHVTLLDLDVGRFGGGWGRLKYAIEQLIKFAPAAPELTPDKIAAWDKWDSPNAVLAAGITPGWITYLQSKGVFFASPLDLDFMMLRAFPAAYGIDVAKLAPPAASTIKAVLGESHGDIGQYTAEEQTFFAAYHRIFKLGSKPAAHVAAMAEIEELDFKIGMPTVLRSLASKVGEMLKGLPE
ncbi:ATP-dependent nuclease [Kinneretia aquatilis]|uniref:ATP-dependent nuclease n=1 Tax=Kinneretia aquatilis TaxID=2070761 RepID=UPI0014952604|nr:TOPRIM nucleotidyl transferase/hydrolase domain-containing protein [Paucibacter aquatile]WIV97507.1 AAA family ATPase [Paucibacter aquatile]